MRPHFSLFRPTGCFLCKLQRDVAHSLKACENKAPTFLKEGPNKYYFHPDMDWRGPTIDLLYKNRFRMPVNSAVAPAVDFSC